MQLRFILDSTGIIFVAVVLPCKHTILIINGLVVVELVFYVHGQQLRSCRDGQLSYPHCSWASLPETCYQYLAPILSPLTENCSS